MKTVTECHGFTQYIIKHLFLCNIVHIYIRCQYLGLVLRLRTMRPVSSGVKLKRFR